MNDMAKMINFKGNYNPQLVSPKSINNIYEVNQKDSKIIEGNNSTKNKKSEKFGRK